MFKIDLHTHTIASGHAYSTLQENIQIASLNQLELMGMSDHASSMPGAPHEFYFQNMKVIPSEISNVKILKGIEANIIDYNGNIDVPESILKKLDYVIASLHPPIIDPGSCEENTQTLLNIMDNPFVTVIGHPDDGRYPMDYEAIVIKAKATKTLIEINNASLNPKGSRVDGKKHIKTILMLCKEYKTPILLGSDAHISFDVGNFDRCISILKELDFPIDLIANTSIEKLYACSKLKMSSKS